MVLFLRIPDDVLSLPPQPWLNWCTVVCTLQGWSAALIDNAFNGRPILAAGVHRQVLFASVGFGIGYYLRKRMSWKYARRDRELEEYMKRHPEDFKRPDSVAGIFRGQGAQRTRRIQTTARTPSSLSSLPSEDADHRVWRNVRKKNVQNTAKPPEKHTTAIRR